jgi:hypothetical protein
MSHWACCSKVTVTMFLKSPWTRLFNMSRNLAQLCPAVQQSLNLPRVKPAPRT